MSLDEAMLALHLAAGALRVGIKRRMKTRTIGPFTVSALGFGCMSLSHAYGAAMNAQEGRRLLRAALEMGYSFFDTAALYGFGANEALIGEALKDVRANFILASKCGIIRTEDGRREINGRPDLIKLTCEESLQRLQTDVIDLYYLHRWDKRVAIEESVGALSDLVKAGKVRAIGLSEVSAAVLRKAHAVHPIAAVQSEYSLWTRNPEIGVLETCRRLGVGFVAFGALGRGFLAGGVRDPATFSAGDIRKAMPRFQQPAFGANWRLFEEFSVFARDLGVSPAQACLGWVLAQGDHIVPIPGTTNFDHAVENLAAANLHLDQGALARMEEIINSDNVVGARYGPASQREVDTEEFVVTEMAGRG